MLFCPQTLYELHFAPIILWLYANYILYLMLTLQHSLCKPCLVAFFFFSFYMSERRGRATGLPDSITGLLRPAYDCFWNNARRRRMQDSYTIVPHHRPLTANPHLIYAPRPLMERGVIPSALVYCVPLSAGWELKPPFCFLQTLFPYF